MPITAGDEAPGPGPAGGGRGAPCAGEPAQESLLEEEIEKEDRARAARRGERTRVGQGWNARRHGRAEKILGAARVKRTDMQSAFWSNRDKRCTL